MFFVWNSGFSNSYDVRELCVIEFVGERGAKFSKKQQLK
jgi:hypothetical protein